VRMGADSAGVNKKYVGEEKYSPPLRTSFFLLHIFAATVAERELLLLLHMYYHQGRREQSFQRIKSMMTYFST